MIDHLSDLSSHLGMSLEFVGREVPIGRFCADIEARDADGRKVLIENQFGPTDHEHFGQLVMYACESRADVVVWLAAGSDRSDRTRFDMSTVERWNGSMRCSLDTSIFSALSYGSNRTLGSSQNPSSRYYPDSQ